MAASHKLALYAGVLVAVMTLGLAGGSMMEPIGLSEARPATEHGGMVGEAGGLPGLAVASGGYRLVASTDTAAAGRPVPYSFRILNEAGALTDFDLGHTKPMHLIVVRRDFGVFLHEHPGMRDDGTWSTVLAPLTPGAYRVFADFVVDGDKHTLGIDLFVPGETSLPAPPSERTSADAGDGYAVELHGTAVAAGDETLEFTIRHHGQIVDDVATYLGARGHLVVLRAGDLAYLHVHADEDHHSFDVEFPSAGTYRLFLQFRHGGEVRTATFTVDAEEANR